MGKEKITKMTLLAFNCPVDVFDGSFISLALFTTCSGRRL